MTPAYTKWSLIAPIQRFYTKSGVYNGLGSRTTMAEFYEIDIRRITHGYMYVGRQIHVPHLPVMSRYMGDNKNDTEHIRTEINRYQTLVTSLQHYCIQYKYFTVERKLHFEQFTRFLIVLNTEITKY
jgi:hypothetical protein